MSSAMQPSPSMNASSVNRSNWTVLFDIVRKFDVQRNDARVGIQNWKQECISTATFSFLFLLWGLAYGLLDLMNYHVKVAMNITRQQAAFLALGYYFAYIPGSLLIGGPLVKKCGYRAAAVAGLCLLAAGDFLMSVGAAHYSFTGMVGSHIVVGLGVSTLERAANPYVTNCGPRKRATNRILVAQAWAGIGTVIAPPLANAFIFNPHSSNSAPEHDLSNPRRCMMPPPSLVDKRGDLSTVVGFYQILGAAICVLAAIVAFVFFRTRWVREVPVAQSPRTGHKRLQFWKHPLVSKRYARLWGGVVANFFNLGCQVAFAQFFMEHMRVNACVTDKWAAQWMAVAQGAFVAGRFAAATLVTLPMMSSRLSSLGRFLKPRLVLATFVAGAVTFTGAGIGLTGSLAVGAASLVMFCEAPSFPMIFESATAGFDEWTPTAETLMIVSICGGGLLPMLMGLLTEDAGVSIGWVIVTCCFGLVFIYTVANNVLPSYRNTLDVAHGESEQEERPFKDEETGSRQHSEGVLVSQHVESIAQTTKT